MKAKIGGWVKRVLNGQLGPMGLARKEKLASQGGQRLDQCKFPLDQIIQKLP